MILAFSGEMGSGKTRLSYALAEEIAYPKIGFGEYLRHIAKNEQREATREYLQELGEILVTTDPVGFTRDVLKFADWKQGEPLIVDGMRHIEVLSALHSEVSPSPLHLIYVDTASSIRHSRLIDRDKTESIILDQLERHSTEAQSDRLRGKANLVLDGSIPVDQLVKIIISSLTQWSQQ